MGESTRYHNTCCMLVDDDRLAVCGVPPSTPLPANVPLPRAAKPLLVPPLAGVPKLKAGAPDTTELLNKLPLIGDGGTDDAVEVANKPAGTGDCVADLTPPRRLTPRSRLLRGVLAPMGSPRI